MLFGSFNFDNGKLGGWKIINQDASKLPQDLTSATGKLFTERVGTRFTALWYLATQPVNGMNHFLICKAENSDRENTKSIVGVIVNIPAGSIGGEGATIREVIEDVALIEGNDPDNNIKEFFDKAVSGLTGNKLRPVVYLGSKVMKGVHHYIICESRTNHSDEDPFAALVELRVFMNEANVENFVKLAA